MITSNQGKEIPCLMKLAHYLQYYEQRHGIRLSREAAEIEAAREGFILDRGGEREPKSHSAKHTVSC